MSYFSVLLSFFCWVQLFKIELSTLWKLDFFKQNYYIKVLQIFPPPRSSFDFVLQSLILCS